MWGISNYVGNVRIQIYWFVYFILLSLLPPLFLPHYYLVYVTAVSFLAFRMHYADVNESDL